MSEKKRTIIQYRFPDGNYYEGEVIDGNIFDGKGKFVYTHNDVYEGEFSNGVRSGNGKYTFANGKVYEGGFLNDVFHGKGSVTFPLEMTEQFDNREYDLREKYIGTWNNGKENGRFVHYYGGVPYDVEYEDGKEVQSKLYFDLDKGDDLTDPDSIKCYFGGQSAFIIETEDETFVFDWYRSSIPPLNSDKPVYIFISHIHLDHFNRRIFSLVKKYNVKGIYIGYDMNDPDADGNFQNFLSSYEDVVSCFNGEQYLLTDFGTVRSLESTDLGVAFIVKTRKRTFFHAGDLFCRSALTLKSFKDKLAKSIPAEMREQVNLEVSARKNFDTNVGSSESMFKSYTKTLANVGPIDYAVLPMDPRWYDFGMRTVNHYLAIADIRLFTPMHLWEQWDFVSDYIRVCPYMAKKMVSVNPNGYDIYKSIVINKPYFIKF